MVEAFAVGHLLLPSLRPDRGGVAPPRICSMLPMNSIPLCERDAILTTPANCCAVLLPLLCTARLMRLGRVPHAPVTLAGDRELRAGRRRRTLDTETARSNRQQAAAVAQAIIRRRFRAGGVEEGDHLVYYLPMPAKRKCLRLMIIGIK